MMWNIIKNGYRSGWTYMLACPVLFMVPVVVEMLQHVIEVQIGMYDSIAAAQAVEHHPARLLFGMFKIASLMLATYWVTRFVAFGHDPLAPARRDRKAVRLFAVYTFVQLILAALGLWSQTLGTAFFVAQFLLSLVLSGALICWAAAAALGNEEVGPTRSAQIAGVHMLWVGLFVFFVILPLMIPHYALAILAVKTSPGPLGLWALLAVDSIVVGLLASVMVAVSWYIASWLAQKKDVHLLP